MSEEQPPKWAVEAAKTININGYLYARGPDQTQRVIDDVARIIAEAAEASRTTPAEDGAE